MDDPPLPPSRFWRRVIIALGCWFFLLPLLCFGLWLLGKLGGGMSRE